MIFCGTQKKISERKKKRLSLSIQQKSMGSNVGLDPTDIQCVDKKKIFKQFFFSVPLKRRKNKRYITVSVKMNKSWDSFLI